MAATIQKTLKPTKYRAVDTSTSEQIISQNHLVNPSFGSNIDNWNTSYSATHDSTDNSCKVTIDSDGSYAAVYPQSSGWTDGVGHNYVAGKRYRVRFKAKGSATNQIRVQDNTSNTGGLNSSTPDSVIRLTTSYVTYEINWTANENSNTIVFARNSTSETSWTFNLDDIEVYLINSFGNNNHGQIYSGRGLEFDGVSDYAVIPNADASKPTDNFTIACWVNIASGSGTWKTIYGKSSFGAGIWFAVDTSEHLVCGIKDVVHYSYFKTTSGSIPINAWVRCVVTYERTGSTCKGVIYLNGVAAELNSGGYEINENSTGVTATSAGHTDDSYRLGLSNTYYMDGKMSDFQMWHATWSASDVLYDYLNPESLALNNSGTSLTESNLKLWYPMQDGHRGQQSYIMDGANTGLSDEILTNADFSSYTNISGTIGNSNVSGINLTGWAEQGGTDGTAGDTVGSGAYTISSINNGFRIDITEAASSTYHHRIYQPLTLTIGVTYRVAFEMRSNTTASHVGGIRDQDSDPTSSDIGTLDGPNVWTSYEDYFTWDGQSGDGDTVMGMHFWNGSGNVGDYLEVRNASVKAVNDKHHAATEFENEEMILKSKNQIFDQGTNLATYAWDEYNSPTSTTITSDGKLQVVTNGDGTTTQGAKLEVSGNITAPVAGRTYRIRAMLDNGDGANLDATYKFSFGGTAATITASDGTPSDGTITTSEEEYYADVAAANSTGDLIILIPSAANDAATTFTIDSVSVKELGVASGWTDADQQIDIPQTALQSYNQLAWATDTGESVEISNHSDFSFTTGSADKPFSISAWCMQAEDDALYIFQQGGYGSGIHQWEYSLYINSVQKIQFSLHDGATADGGARNDNTNFVKWLTDSAVASKGEWFHIVATYNATKGATNGKIYINGEKVNTTYTETGTYQYMTNQGFSAMMFKRGTSGSYTGPGSLNEISIWDTALSAAEVTELYNNGKAMDCLLHSQYISDPPELVAYWRNNGLATWTNLENPGTHDATLSNFTETLLLPAGVDASRDTQGYLMNRQKTTNCLNMYNEKHETSADIDKGVIMKRVGNPLTETEQEAMTVMVWFKAPDNTQSDAFFVVATDGAAHLTVQTQGTGRFRWTYEVNGFSGNARYRTVSNTFETNKWSFAAFVCDTDIGSDSDRVKCYVGDIDSDLALATLDGTQTGSPTSGMEDDQVWLGGDKPSGKKFTGQMDDFLIYNRILTLDEIKRNFKAGKRSHK